MGRGALSSFTFTPLSLPLSESPEPLVCLPDMLPADSSLTLLLAALMACLVPMMVPLPGLLLTAAEGRGAAVRPDGGRLALVFFTTGAAKDLVEELNPFELLAESERALLLPLTCPRVLELVDVLIWLLLLILPALGDDGQVAIGELDEFGMPSL